MRKTSANTGRPTWTRRLLLAGAVASAMSVMTGSACFAADQDVIARVARGWQRRQAAVHTARYVLTGTATVPKGAYNNLPGISPRVEGAAVDCPPKDTTFEINRSYVFELDHNQVRKDLSDQIWSPELQQFLPRREVFVFDGDHVVSWRPRAENTVGAGSQPDELFPEFRSYGQGEAMNALRDAADLPLWFSHGAIELAAAPAQDLRRPIDASLWAVDHAEPMDADNMTLQRRTIQGTTQTAWGYRVALPMDSAVTRLTCHFNDMLVNELLVTYLERDGFWVPDAWSMTEYGPDKQIMMGLRFKCAECTLNGSVDASEFVLKPPRGAVVQNADGLHRVERDDETLTRIIVAPPAPPTAPGRASGSAGSARTVAMIAGPVVVVLLFAIVLLRRFKRAGSS